MYLARKWGQSLDIVRAGVFLDEKGTKKQEIGMQAVLATGNLERKTEGSTVSGEEVETFAV